MERLEQDQSITVVLADDHAVVRQGVRDFLEEDPAIKVIAETENGAEAWRLIADRRPAVAVLDVCMPEISGIELTRRIKTQYPATRVLILSAFDDETYIYASLQAGADGYVLKTAPSSDLVRAVRQVYAGQNVIDPNITAKVLAGALHAPPALSLTDRELDVVRGVAKGWTNREIAGHLAISDRTIQGHLAAIFAKLHVRSRTEVVTLALQRGLITLDDAVGA